MSDSIEQAPSTCVGALVSGVSARVIDRGTASTRRRVATGSMSARYRLPILLPLT
jgi:hypothetical protein